MPHPQRRIAAVLALGTALMAACGDAPTETPAQPTDAAQAASHRAGQADARPGEARFRALSQQFPEFGGFYFDEQGDIVVQLTSTGRGAAVRSALGPVISAVARERARTAGAPRVHVRQAEFTFTQLSDWRDRTQAALFDVDGVTMMDVDERTNRLVVGLADEGARGEAQARVRDLGVPAGMVSMKVVGRSAPLSGTASTTSLALSGCTSVYSYCRPLMGGLSISFYRDGSSAYSTCTLGFTATVGSAEKWVTASHCSDDEWNLDFTAYHQPTPTSSVGTESRDPNGVSCGWGSLYVCRYSDATLVTPTATVAVGHIIRPSGLGLRSVSPINPYFKVAGQRDAYSGERVYAVGQTTGLHTGTMQGTCQDWKKTFEGRYHAVRCSDVADFNSSPGDSGGPVFLWDGSSETVTLVGVNFARNGTWDHAVFSPVSGITRDLGTFDARAYDLRATSGGGGGDDGGGGSGGCSGCELPT